MKNLKRCLSLILTFIIVIGFFAPIQSNAAKIKINKKSITVYTGKTKTLKLKGVSKKQSKKIKWSSSDTDIVSVNKNGKIKGIDAGKAYVYAKYKGKKYKCKVTVKYNSNSDIYAEKTNITIEKGKTVGVLIYTDRGKNIYAYEDNSHVSISFGSWNGKTRILNITANSEGSSKIVICDSNDEDVYTTINVTVTPNCNTVLTASIYELNIPIGETKTVTISTDKGFSITAKRSNSNISLSWGDWNGNDAPLYITGESIGTSQITVSDVANANLNVTITINVTPPPINVSLEPQMPSTFYVWDNKLYVAKYEIQNMDIDVKYNNYNSKYTINVSYKVKIISKSQYVTPKFDYKLYDKDGVIVKSGTELINGEADAGEITIGDFSIYSIDPGDYNLKIVDYRY